MIAGTMDLAKSLALPSFLLDFVFKTYSTSLLLGIVGLVGLHPWEQLSQIRCLSIIFSMATNDNEETQRLCEKSSRAHARDGGRNVRWFSGLCLLQVCAYIMWGQDIFAQIFFNISRRIQRQRLLRRMSSPTARGFNANHSFLYLLNEWNFQLGSRIYWVPYVLW